MPQKLADTGKLNNHSLHCPAISKQVSAGERQQFSIPGGLATWWHCPECRGWHVVVGPSLEAYLPRVNQESLNSVA
jgi:hypothetical protein